MMLVIDLTYCVVVVWFRN